MTNVNLSFQTFAISKFEPQRTNKYTEPIDDIECWKDYREITFSLSFKWKEKENELN